MTEAIVYITLIVLVLQAANQVPLAVAELLRSCQATLLAIRDLRAVLNPPAASSDDNQASSIDKQRQ
ncbi:hypothetical protein AB0L63_03795 [Nocardia sp. NPDC051990]|uniref:hypothetical protein n=1 Tax=Nocardia sp. NPDC051990 TaxID=3155285 RepID=UPI00341B8A9E